MNSTSLPKNKIVILDGYSLNPGDLSWAPFEKHGELAIYDHSAPLEGLERALEADVVVVNKFVISREMMAAIPSLKMIVVTATGMNNIDHDAAAEIGIKVRNVAGYSTDSVAQQVFAFLLQIQNHVAIHNDSVRNGDWSNQPHFSYSIRPLRELAHKTIGVYGFGTIGKRVIELALAFKMNVLVHSTFPDDTVEDVTFVSLAELFERSDFVTVHTQLDEHKKQIINYNLLSKMKPSAWLINTARGGLIHELELSKALDDKRLSGAALDVLSSEPPEENHPLVGRSDVFLTPHHAWASVESRTRLLEWAARNIEELD